MASCEGHLSYPLVCITNLYGLVANYVLHCAYVQTYEESQVKRMVLATLQPTATHAGGTLDTWIGTVHVVASSRGVCRVTLPDWRQREGHVPQPEINGAVPAISADGPSEAQQIVHQALEELAEYFAGERRKFDVSLDLAGTPFFRQVWEAVARIPFGQTQSYAGIARVVAREKAVRAVGAANAANPVPIFVPCHRVVGSDGKLTGFAYGTTLKAALLRHEGGR